MLSHLIVHPDINHAQATAEQLLHRQVSELKKKIDHHLIQPAKTQITIKQVRELQQTIHIQPEENTIKAYFLNPADQLSLPAQHALLKILEETPSHAMIFLVAQSSQPFLSTIKSRTIIHQPIVAANFELSSENLQVSQINDILKSPPVARLAKLEKPTDRQQLLKTINQLIQIHHQLLTNQSQAALSHNLKCLTKTYKYLKANVNLQLAMDQLYLHLHPLPINRTHPKNQE